MIREGRFGKKMDEEVANYTSSLEFDKNIAMYDLLGSAAHALMLYENKIISKDDASKILKILKQMLNKGVQKLQFDPRDEDIHMVIEKYIIKEIGEVGGKLHTARSRNDQVACDLRMWVRDAVNDTISSIIELANTLLDISAKNVETVLPGYTHLQHAQPTTLAHHFLAHCDALTRDLERLEDAYKRINLNPLGSGALATTSFAIDRKRTAQLLGFDGIIENSIDAVSARDFMLEVLSSLAILMGDIGRMLEELILWSTYEFGFVELSNKFASTSSIMPQKKNPDVLEIVRARASKVLGNLVSSLTLVKSLPYAYNRDLQELSPLLFDSFNVTKSSLIILNKVIKTLKINKKRMLEICNENFITATELADLIVKEKGIPFRTAHRIVGALVSEAIKAGKRPAEINAEFVDEISKKVIGKPLNIKGEKIKRALLPFEAVAAKNVTGGPSPTEVKRMIKIREKIISKKQENLKNRAKRIEDSQQLLFSAMDNLIEG
jgi:argininosuccinate lyase